MNTFIGSLSNSRVVLEYLDAREGELKPEAGVIEEGWRERSSNESTGVRSATWRDKVHARSCAIAMTMRGTRFSINEAATLLSFHELAAFVVD